MVEYRVQVKRHWGWEFLTDSHGKYYTYQTLKTAKKFGLAHAPAYYHQGHGRMVVDPDSVRIVWADIDWQPAEA